MKFQSNVLNRNRYEKWIILFLTLTFVIDISASFFLNGLEGLAFIAYRSSGFIAFTLVLINDIAKYKQTQRKMLLFSIAFFGLLLIGILLSTILALV